MYLCDIDAAKLLTLGKTNSRGFTGYGLRNQRKQSNKNHGGYENADGNITITNMTMMVGHILGQQNSEFIAANADINQDGSITITDVTETVSIILNGNNTQSYLTCPDDYHPHMIDLDLPSGTKWACCNVGATTPEESYKSLQIFMAKK